MAGTNWQWRKSRTVSTRLIMWRQKRSGLNKVCLICMFLLFCFRQVSHTPGWPLTFATCKDETVILDGPPTFHLPRVGISGMHNHTWYIHSEVITQGSITLNKHSKEIRSYIPSHEFFKLKTKGFFEIGVLLFRNGWPPIYINPPASAS